MAKVTTNFVCSNCGAVYPKWTGKCTECGEWNTLTEELVKTSTTKEKSVLISNAKPIKLDEISHEKLERVKTGIDEFDRVLGGGVVPASMVLIGGEPGMGKSTLVTTVAGVLAKNSTVLYVSAEESCSQLKMRAVRLGVNGENLLVLSETSLENIESCLDNVSYLVIDSIQAVYLEELSSSAGSVSQVRECASRLMRIAKSKRITTFIIGHVTKEGAIAGPKVLEHIMDTVLYIEGDNGNNFRILRAVKNRFGSVNEVGVFEMRENGLIGVKDYSGVFMSSTRGENAGSIVTPSVTGNRCVPVEIQSLVSKTPFGLPRRMSQGIDYNKMILMLAVLEKKAGYAFYNQDVYLNAMSGLKLSEPSIDLAIALSLVSSSLNKPIPKTTACFGEVGLTGEVRGVFQAEMRVKECINMGFESVILPYSNLKAVKKYEKDIKLLPVSYLYQATKLISEDKKD